MKLNIGEQDSENKFEEAYKLADECRKTFNFACDDVQLKLMVSRIIWEKEMENKMKAEEIEKIKSELKEVYKKQLPPSADSQNNTSQTNCNDI